MARTTKPTRASARQTAEPAPKKRPGRPAGTKNRIPASKARSAPAAPAKRVVARRSEAPAAPKLNKAELEAQVVKLERTVARQRKQIAELKQTVREGSAEAPKATRATVATKQKRAAAPKTGRGRKPPAEQALPVREDETDEADGASAEE